MSDTPRRLASPRLTRHPLLLTPPCRVLLLRWRLPDAIGGNVDFLGLNYYGTNTVSMHGLAWRDGVEYSSSGRENDADHLYSWLRAYWLRYGVDLFVTENGIDDAEDILRPAYLLEHLAAVAAARAEGIPVLGYVFWTVSDNLEWSDVCRILLGPDSSTSRSSCL